MGDARHPGIEVEREVDGRWIAEFVTIPGVLAYGETEAEAVADATALAKEVIEDRVMHGEQARSDG